MRLLVPVWLVPVGVVAGVTTTVAGMGGGVLLLIGLAAAWGDPVRALAVATPALLVGNLHRAALFRGSLDRSAGPWIAMSLVGALVGSLALLGVPPIAVQVALVGTAAVAVLRHLGVLRLGVPARWLGAAGLGVGVLSSAGGAGLLAGPVLQAAGFVGDRYVANLAASAVAMHAGRLVAFEAGGALDAAILRDAALLGVGIPVGNAIGRWARHAVSEQTQARIEVWTMAALALGSVLALAS